MRKENIMNEELLNEVNGGVQVSDANRKFGKKVGGKVSGLSEAHKGIMNGQETAKADLNPAAGAGIIFRG